MPIDSATKRRSVSGYTLGTGLVLPVADGAIAVDDRAHVVGLYSGLFVEDENDDGAVSFAGAAAAAFKGQRVTHGGAAYAGAATALFAGQRLAQASAGFAGAASFAIGAQRLAGGFVTFGGSAIALFRCEPTATLLGEILGTAAIMPALKIERARVVPALDAGDE